MYCFTRFCMKTLSASATGRRLLNSGSCHGDFSILETGLKRYGQNDKVLKRGLINKKFYFLDQSSDVEVYVKVQSARLSRNH